jgi:serine/threonine-protein phosphatase 4 regulatory subunit 1
VLDEIIGMLLTLLQDSQLEVKTSAVDALVSVAELLTPEDRESHVLTLALSLAHDDENMENRLTAINLLSKLSNLFPYEICQQFIGMEMISLAEDPMFKVRKQVAFDLRSVIKNVKKEF